MGPKSPWEMVAEYERLAGEVNRDMPGRPIDERMREAMKRNKGSMHPLYVREALLRTAPAQPSSEEKP